MTNNYVWTNKVMKKNFFNFLNEHIIFIMHGMDAIRELSAAVSWFSRSLNFTPLEFYFIVTF